MDRPRKLLRSPVPNHHGVYEVHDVIDRHQARMLADGWVEIAVEQPAQAPEAGEKSRPASASPVGQAMTRKPGRPRKPVDGDTLVADQAIGDALPEVEANVARVVRFDAALPESQVRDGADR